MAWRPGDLPARPRRAQYGHAEGCYGSREYEDEYGGTAEVTVRHELLRLVAQEPNRVQTFTREIEIVESMSRIYRLCRKIARTEWGGTSPRSPEATER